MVLAIDASISSTGYAVVESDNNLVDLGKFTTKKNKKIDASVDEDNRVFFITNSLEKIIDDNNITVVSMESQFFCKNPKTAMQLSRLRGAIMYVVKSRGIEIEYPTPSEIRSNLMNNGSASKEEVCEYIREFYKDDKRVIDLGEFNDKPNKDKNSDIYDAIGIGLAHNNSVKKG